MALWLANAVGGYTRPDCSRLCRDFRIGEKLEGLYIFTNIYLEIQEKPAVCPLISCPHITPINQIFVVQRGVIYLGRKKHLAFWPRIEPLRGLTYHQDYTIWL